jgi:hypothetical protein
MSNKPIGSIESLISSLAFHVNNCFSVLVPFVKVFNCYLLWLYIYFREEMKVASNSMWIWSLNLLVIVIQSTIGEE